MLLKFWYKNNDIILDSKKGELLDITADYRTKMLNKDEMSSKHFQIGENVFILKKDFFVRMAKLQNRETIEALKIIHDNKIILIVGEGSCVFYEGSSINVETYGIEVNEQDGIRLSTSC